MTVAQAFDASMAAIRHSSPERIAEARMEAQDVERELLMRDARCEDCEECRVAPGNNMQPLTKYIVHFMREHYQLKEGATVTEERAEYDISRACGNASKLCSFCMYIQEFVNADEAVGDCEGFIPC